MSWSGAAGIPSAVKRMKMSDRWPRQDRETTVEEDIHLVESVQRGLKSRGYVPGPLVIDPMCGVNSEHSIMHLQHWIREAVAGVTT